MRAGDTWDRKAEKKKEMGEEKQTTEQFPSKQASKKLWNDVYGVGGKE